MNILKEYIKHTIKTVMLEKYDLKSRGDKYYLMAYINPDTIEQLKDFHLKGVKGISTSKFIVYDYIGRRDFCLVMDISEFDKINKNKVDLEYNNPNQFFWNDMELLRRLRAREEYTNQYIIGMLLDEYIIFLRKNENNYPNLYFTDYISGDIVTEEVAKYSSINSINDAISIIEAIILKKASHHNNEYFQKNFEHSKRYLRDSIERSIREMISGYEHEEEIFIYSDQINIPKNSRIIAFISRANYENLTTDENARSHDFLPYDIKKMIKYSDNIKELENAGYKILFSDPKNLQNTRSNFFVNKVYKWNKK
jgi:hypothetical protein